MKPMKAKDLFEPRAIKLARAIVNAIDTKKISRDVHRLVDVERIRRDGARVFDLGFPPMAPAAEHDGVGPMDAMLRCPGGHWHKRENATTESRMNEQGALVQVVVCGHKVGK